MFDDTAMKDWPMDLIPEDDWSESGENMDEDGESKFVPDPIGSCEAVNELLSKDMMQMTPGDRTSVAEELHGVSCLAIEENDDEVTTERVTKALYELDQILEYKIPANQKGAFLKAKSFVETRGTYVNDVGFKMKFLRCKLFNVEEAARLLVDYLELVQELYGDVCLSRPIRLDDVQSSKEERAAFRSGYIQLLPFGDRAGRRIAMITTDALDYSSFIRVRTLHYLIEASCDMMYTDTDATLTIFLAVFYTYVATAGEDILILMDCCLERRFNATKGCYPDLLGWTKRYGTTSSKRTAANQKIFPGYTSKNMRNPFLFPRYTLLSNGTGNFYTHCRSCGTSESIEISCRRRNGIEISSWDLWSPGKSDTYYRNRKRQKRQFPKMDWDARDSRGNGSAGSGGSKAETQGGTSETAFADTISVANVDTDENAGDGFDGCR